MIIVTQEKSVHSLKCIHLAADLFHLQTMQEGFVIMV